MLLTVPRWEFRVLPLPFQFGWVSELRRVEINPHVLSFPLSNLPGAEERARKEAAEKEQELMTQKLQEQQQQMEAQKRSLEENICQLKEKMERDRENLIREQNSMLEHKLKVSPAVASGRSVALILVPPLGRRGLQRDRGRKRRCHLRLVF